MRESPEITPEEQNHAWIFKHPAALFRRALARKLGYLIPSFALMIIWFVTREPAYAIVGYGILLHEAVHGLFPAKRGIQTTNRVLAKYEMKGRA